MGFDWLLPSRWRRGAAPRIRHAAEDWPPAAPPDAQPASTWKPVRPPSRPARMAEEASPFGFGRDKSCSTGKAPNIAEV